MACQKLLEARAKENHIFIQKGCNKFIKSDSKDIYNATKDFYFK